MKTKTWIVLFAVMIAVCAFFSYPLLSGSGEAASSAQITSNGELVATVALSQNREFTVKNGDSYNVITVKDGKIAVTEATCPDHYCMNRGFCDSGTEIVCLPNRLVIKFLGQQEIDAAVG